LDLDGCRPTSPFWIIANNDVSGTDLNVQGLKGVTIAVPFAALIANAFTFPPNVDAASTLSRRKAPTHSRQLGANLRQCAANSSLAEETQLPRGVADRLSSVETQIRELAPQTYPWARRPSHYGQLLEKR
jgi:hypothetical protein